MKKNKGNMKLIKINTDHYVIVDETIQPVNGFYYDNFINKIKNTNGAEYGEASHCWQITHSTRPFGGNATAISLHDVKELIGELDVDKKVEEVYPQTYYSGIHIDGFLKAGYVKGYNQALEDNKEKKYTEEDVISIVKKSRETGLTAEYLLLSLQPKTEWEVCFVDGKLKLI